MRVCLERERPSAHPSIIPFVFRSAYRVKRGINCVGALFLCAFYASINCVVGFVLKLNSDHLDLFGLDVRFVRDVTTLFSTT